MNTAEKLLHNEKFKFESAIRGDKKIILLKGIIDEDATFDAIKKLGGPFVFNFRELVAINSCGIRSWVNFLKELSGIKIYYEECPPLIVRQMNMVPSFLGQAEVLSVFLPYVCETTEEEQLSLMDLTGVTDPASQVAMKLPCKECKSGEMEFDGHPKQYFAFWR